MCRYSITFGGGMDIENESIFCNQTAVKGVRAQRSAIGIQENKNNQYARQAN